MIDSSLIMWFVFGLVFVLLFVYIFMKRKEQTPTIGEYHYLLKQKVMTNAEKRFYDKLLSSIGDKHYIVPQAHLSMFINHKIKGQNWRGAFSRINGKSVDFLIVEKSTQCPVMAIELDDYTHNRDDRIRRDDFVNKILAEVGLPLERCTSDTIPNLPFIQL